VTTTEVLHDDVLLAIFGICMVEDQLFVALEIDLTFYSEKKLRKER